MKAIRARLLHVVSTSPLDWEYFDDGVLQTENGRVVAAGAAQQFANDGFDLSICDHHPDQLLVPGFIDTHVHSPQIDVIASYSQQLLDWLEHHTFPAECRFADEAYAAAAAADFLDGLIAAGTTTAMVYVTSHMTATDAFFSAADARSMRMIAGKVMMDRHAPAELCDTAESSDRDSRNLIDRWHGKGRLGYAVTPRFAVSSSPEQLKAAGNIHRDVPDTWVQTHLSENHQEIAKVGELFPEAQDYLDVYDRFGLLSDRAVFGHCIHLKEREKKRMADAGGKVAFCPTSNLFLGSGLMDYENLVKSEIDITIASDVGGGTSLSMFRTLADAFKVCQLQGQSLDPIRAFAMMTLGNAEALGLEHQIGNFKPGKEADFVLLAAPENSILARRVSMTDSIEDEIFAYITMADEAVVAQTYINGEAA